MSKHPPENICSYLETEEGIDCISLHDLLMQLNLEDCLNLLQWATYRIHDEIDPLNIPRTKDVGYYLDYPSSVFCDELEKLLQPLTVKNTFGVLKWLRLRLRNLVDLRQLD